MRSHHWVQLVKVDSFRCPKRQAARVHTPEETVKNPEVQQIFEVTSTVVPLEAWDQFSGDFFLGLVVSEDRFQNLEEVLS